MLRIKISRELYKAFYKESQKYRMHTWIVNPIIVKMITKTSEISSWSWSTENLQMKQSASRENVIFNNSHSPFAGT